MSETFYNKMLNLLMKNGMFQSQANEVMKMVCSSNEFAEMATRWTDRASDYPENLQHLIWSMIRRVALTYIERECPLAWFRPMFLPTDEFEKFLEENNYEEWLKQHRSTSGAIVH